MGSKKGNCFFHGADEKLDARLSRWSTVSFLVLVAWFACVSSRVPYDVKTYALSYYERISP